MSCQHFFVRDLKVVEVLPNDRNTKKYKSWWLHFDYKTNLYIHSEEIKQSFGHGIRKK